MAPRTGRSLRPVRLYALSQPIGIGLPRRTPGRVRSVIKLPEGWVPNHSDRAAQQAPVSLIVATPLWPVSRSVVAGLLTVPQPATEGLPDAQETCGRFHGGVRRPAPNGGRSAPNGGRPMPNGGRPAPNS